MDCGLLCDRKVSFLRHEFDAQNVNQQSPLLRVGVHLETALPCNTTHLHVIRLPSQPNSASQLQNFACASCNDGEFVIHLVQTSLENRTPKNTLCDQIFGTETDYQLDGVGWYFSCPFSTSSSAPKQTKRSSDLGSWTQRWWLSCHLCNSEFHQKAEDEPAEWQIRAGVYVVDDLLPPTGLCVVLSF